MKQGRPEDAFHDWPTRLVIKLRNEKISPVNNVSVDYYDFNTKNSTK